jgi:hypothetical protein
MRLSTPALFLIGSRAAILDAADRWRTTLIVGALLVLSAGLARNYDGEDLLAEPWWLLGPYAASLITGLLLFSLYKAIASGKGTPLPWRMLVPFIGLYWLTAPLAWLYGVPYERLLSPVGAVYANAVTLAVVAVWRVLLMARVARVLLGCSPVLAGVIDLWFGVVVIWLASLLGPKPVLDVMGGLRLSEVEKARADLVYGTIFFGFLTMIVLFVPAIIAIKRVRMPRLNELVRFGVVWPLGAGTGQRGFGWGAIALAGASVLAWTPALVIEQPRQRSARLVEEALHAGRFDEALDVLDRTPRERFPEPWGLPRERARHWTLSGEPDGPFEAALRRPRPLPAWVRRELVDRVGNEAAHALMLWHGDTWAESLALMPAQQPTALEDDERDAVAERLRWISAQADVLTPAEIDAVGGVLRTIEKIEAAPPQR